MPLARCQCDLRILPSTCLRVDGRAIEEDIVTWGRTVRLGIDNEFVRSLVVIVRQDERAEVNIIIKTCRAVDVDSPNNTVPVLGGKVRMIPAGPILAGNIGIESFTLGRNRTLSEAVDAILELICNSQYVSR